MTGKTEQEDGEVAKALTLIPALMAKAVVDMGEVGSDVRYRFTRSASSPRHQTSMARRSRPISTSTYLKKEKDADSGR